jgi:hypothetical protein
MNVPVPEIVSNGFLWFGLIGKRIAACMMQYLGLAPRPLFTSQFLMVRIYSTLTNACSEPFHEPSDLQKQVSTLLGEDHFPKRLRDVSA